MNSRKITELYVSKSKIEHAIPTYFKMKYLDINDNDREALWNVFCMLIEAVADNKIDIKCMSRELRDALYSGKVTIRLCRRDF